MGIVGQNFLVIVHCEVEAEVIKQMAAIYIRKKVLDHKIASPAERFTINFQCCEQETSGLGVLQWANGGRSQWSLCTVLSNEQFVMSVASCIGCTA
jgi:hypothetical protein